MVTKKAGFSNSVNKFFSAITLMLLLVTVVFSTYTPVRAVETSKVQAITRSGFVNAVATTLLNGAKAPTTKNWYLTKAVKEGWVPKAYTTAEWASAIRRDEAAYILAKAKKLPTAIDYSCSDVAADKYSAQIQSVIAAGYMSGYSSGMFKGSNVMSQTEGNAVVANLKLTDKQLKERMKFSPDGRRLRTTNLPKNAKRFEYILADVSNKYYEGVNDFSVYKITLHQPSISAWEMRTGKFLEIPEQLKKNQTVVKTKVVPEEYTKEYKDLFAKPENLKIIAKKYENYITQVMNVDYRTIDESWAKKVYEPMHPWSTYEAYKERIAKAGINNFYLDYVNYAKKHKIIIKSDRVQVEPTAIFSNDPFITIRAYYKVNVVSFENLGVESDVHLLFFGNTFGDIPANRLVKGTYEGYVNKFMIQDEKSSNELDYVFAPTQLCGLGMDLVEKDVLITALNQKAGV